MLLEYIEDIDDKLFKEYSNSKNFNSFLNEFDCATNKEDKENVVKKLKDKNSFVNHYIFIMNEDSEYSSKLIDIVNTIGYFLDEYSEKWASDFNWWKQSNVIKKKIFVSFVCIKWIHLHYSLQLHGEKTMLKL